MRLPEGEQPRYLPLSGGFMNAEVRNYRGGPVLFIDDTPEFFGGFYLELRSDLSDLETKIRYCKECGIRILNFDLQAWHADAEREAFTEWLETVFGTIHRVHPGAALYPRVHLNAPPWWREEHPEECQLRSDGTRDFASFASDLWLKDAGDVLRRFLEYIDGSMYAPIFMGCMPHVGSCGEWVDNTAGHNFGDFSAPMQCSFRRYLKQKYQTEGALRGAWADDAVGFETASVPSTDEQLATDTFAFRNPANSAKVPDYYEHLADLSAAAALHFARIAKHSSRDRHVVGLFYGYLLELGWWEHFFNAPGDNVSDTLRTPYQRSGHLGFRRVLTSDLVDIISCPYSYGFRAIGGEGSFMTLTESLRIHNKIPVIEDDTRTFLTSDKKFGFLHSLEDSVTVMRRNFSQVITRGGGLWWMHHHRFNHDVLKDEITTMKNIGQAAVHLDKAPSGDVAVIVDDESFFRQGLTAEVFYPAIYKQKLWETPRSGLACDYYLLNDIEAIADTYRMFVFLNAFYVPTTTRRRIDARLKRDGKTLVWLYGAGCMDETAFSPANTSDLTGISAECEMRAWEMALSITDYDHPVTQDLPEGTHFGSGLPAGPVFYGNDAEARVLGHIVFSEGRCEPGLLVKEYDSWTSVWCCVPLIPSGVLRGLAKYCGVHVYNHAGDITYASGNHVAVNNVKRGKRTVHLKTAARVTELFSGVQFSEPADRIEVDVPPKSTALFALEPGPD